MLTAFPAIAEPHMDHCVVHVYDDRKFLTYPSGRGTWRLALVLMFSQRGPWQCSCGSSRTVLGLSSVSSQLVRMHEEAITPVNDKNKEEA